MLNTQYFILIHEINFNYVQNDIFNDLGDLSKDRNYIKTYQIFCSAYKGEGVVAIEWH